MTCPLADLSMRLFVWLRLSNLPTNTVKFALLDGKREERPSSLMLQSPRNTFLALKRFRKKFINTVDFHLIWLWVSVNPRINHVTYSGRSFFFYEIFFFWQCRISFSLVACHERWSLRYPTATTACPTNGLHLCRYVMVRRLALLINQYSASNYVYSVLL